MRFDLTKPCDNCPFKREGGIRVHPAVARTFAQAQLDPMGASFACHKTTVSDGDGQLIEGPNSQYCGGALAFSAKHDIYNQIQRIAIRLGWWDPSLIEAPARASVFGSVLEMVAAQTERILPRNKRPPMRTTPKRRTF